MCRLPSTPLDKSRQRTCKREGRKKSLKIQKNNNEKLFEFNRDLLGDWSFIVNVEGKRVESGAKRLVII
jgi:hypothetical protein